MNKDFDAPQFLTNLSVAVTGASGYVGLYLCETLSKSGIRIVPIVRQISDSTGSAFKRCEAQRICGDFSGDVDWHSMLKGADIVIHTAGLIERSDKRVNEGSAYYQVNVETTYQIAKAAAQNGVTKFIFLSSAGVYGHYDNKVAALENQVCKPQEPYTQSKYAAEERLLSSSLSDTMQIVILRPPMIYGPECRGNLPQLAKMVRHPVSVPMGSIDGRRNFISVSSLIDGIALILKDSGDASGVWNIAESDQVSVPEVMRAIGRGLYDKEVFIPSVPVSFLRASATLLGKRDLFEKLHSPVLINSKKFSQRFNWQPTMPTLSGIEQAAKSFRIADNELN